MKTLHMRRALSTALTGLALAAITHAQLRSPRCRERTSNRAVYEAAQLATAPARADRATPDADRPLHCTWKIRVATLSG